jgi:hypothetical protein
VFCIVRLCRRKYRIMSANATARRPLKNLPAGVLAKFLAIQIGSLLD